MVLKHLVPLETVKSGTDSLRLHSSFFPSKSEAMIAHDFFLVSKKKATKSSLDVTLKKIINIFLLLLRGIRKCITDF